MKNKNGFISMTLVYTFLVIFLFLMLSILSTYSQKNKFLDGISEKIKDNVKIDNNYYHFGGVENKENYIWDYSFTGTMQPPRQIPADGYYKIELWGASGGPSLRDTISYTTVGRGAYTSGEIFLEKDDKLYVFVGGAGKRVTKQRTKTTSNNSGGYNGGGDGGYENSTSLAGGGGGATDVRINDTAIQARIMVAGGGGGNANWTSPKTGGNATGLNSDNLGNSITANVCSISSLYDGSCYSGSVYATNYFKNATAGTQNAGGAASWSTISNQEYYLTYGGLLGNGGSSSIPYGGGGGGGYYGGGGGSVNTNVVGSGAGGSSYISGHNGCIAITVYSKPKNCSNISQIECSIHYTNKYFTNTVMIDGAGYKWTNTRTNTTTSIPSNPSGNGNGYARITYLRSE